MSIISVFWSLKPSWFNYNYFSAPFSRWNKKLFFLEKEWEWKWERGEEEGGKKHEMQPLVFGHWHLLHSRDCEISRKGYVCLYVCVCASANVCCCPLKRKRVADAFKPPWVQLYTDDQVKCLWLIFVHVNMSLHSTDVKWRRIKGCFHSFSH